MYIESWIVCVIVIIAICYVVRSEMRVEKAKRITDDISRAYDETIMRISKNILERDLSKKERIELKELISGGIVDGADYSVVVPHKNLLCTTDILSLCKLSDGRINMREQIKTVGTSDNNPDIEDLNRIIQDGMDKYWPPSYE